jgi:hypothetical protein
MADDPLATRIDRFIEELICQPQGNAAAVASLLMAAQVALRKDLMPELSLASWEFVDSLRSRREMTPHEASPAPH